MSQQKGKDLHKSLQAMHAELGISPGYAEACGLPIHIECEALQETELDVFSRQPLMEVKAYAAWQKMKFSAQEQGVELQIISAYRSFDYQKQIFQKKLEKGQILVDILKVNVAPGYSEHHSGQAVDIGSPGYEHLSEEFEESPAFSWLRLHAETFGFGLSFPKNNTLGLCYEPWHWKFSEEID